MIKAIINANIYGSDFHNIVYIAAGCFFSGKKPGGLLFMVQKGKGWGSAKQKGLRIDCGTYSKSVGRACFSLEEKLFCFRLKT